MKLGLYMNTHGIGATVDGRWTLQPLPATQMAVPAVAQRAEAAGFDSLWFSDHVLMTRSPASEHRAADPVTGARAYPVEPDMVDAVVGMAAAAAVTSRIRLAPSVWISPYRHPLQDVRQLTSIDIVSGGRLVVAIGPGWLREEFEALDVPFEERVSRLRESVAVYKTAWADDEASFSGQHYAFKGIRMDPKPVQQPRPRIYYGGISATGASIAASVCDGFYPTFTDPLATADRYRGLIDSLPQRLADSGGSENDFSLLGVLSARVDTRTDLGLGKGPVSKILEDLDALGAEGFSLLVLHLDTLDGSSSEWLRQLDLIGEHLVEPAAAIEAAGRWRPA
jgi:probable F420-dependent oxidoreductase